MSEPGKSQLLDWIDGKNGPGPARLAARRAVGLVLVFSIVLTLVLYVIDIQTVIDSPFWLPIFNTVFITLSALVVAYPTAKSYLRSGIPNLLLAGAGVLLFGITSSVAAFWTASSANVGVTIYNTGALLAGALHLGAAILTARGISNWEGRFDSRTRLALVYIGVILVTGLLAFATWSGLTPAFFLPKTGPTPLRQLVLGTGVALFFVASGLFLNVFRHSRSQFIYWYALGLGLIGVGLFTVLLVQVLGTPLTWLGRLDTYLGSIYFIVAVWILVRSARTRGMPFELMLSDFFQRLGTNYRDLVETSPDPIIAVDEESRVLMWNSAAEQLFGITRNRVLGERLTDLIVEDGQENGLRRLLGAVAQSDVQPHNGQLHETELRLRDGRRVPVEFSYSARHVPTGIVITCIIRDISQRKRAEAQAEEGKRILDALMEYVPEGITIADAPEVKIRMVSRYGQDVLGGPHQGITVGAVAEQWKVYYPDGMSPMPDKELPLMRAMLKGELVRDAEVMQVNARGDRLYLLCNAAPISGPSGEILGGIVAWRDNTERRRVAEELRKSEERYRMLFNNMTEGFALHEIITDERGEPVDYRFLEMNPAFENLTGLVRENMIGKLKTAALPNDDPYWIQVYGQVALTGKPVHFENYSPPLERWYEVFAFQPAPRQFASIFIDISERKRAEAEREELLKREQQARAQAEAAVGIRDQFITVASHELKTPLTAIKGYAELLTLRANEERLGEQSRRMAGVIFKQSARLEKMISALLDVTRIDKGQLQLDYETVDLAQLVTTVVHDVELGVRRHEFHYNGPVQGVFVKGNVLRLEQVIQNLLQNAVKYSPLGGKVNVALKANVGMARVAVTDQGIGIPANALPHIFERFYRASNAETHHISGLGIGLYVSNEICKMHGGNIEVTSAEGEGTTFTVCLPLKEISSE